jgi:hypothetical protein
MQMQSVPMTPRQQEAFEELLSTLDNLEVASDTRSTLVFTGDSADGPVLGYIEADGNVVGIANS